MIIFLATWTLELHREHKKIPGYFVSVAFSRLCTTSNFTECVALSTMVRYVSVVRVKQHALIFVSILNGVSHQIDG